MTGRSAMARDRALGGLLALFALTALFVVIPGQTEHIDGASLQPGFFPSTAALIVLVSALVHMLVPRGVSDGGPPLGVIIRNLSVLIAFALTAVVGMQYLGYYVTGPLILAFSMWFMGERRPFWLAIGIGGTTALIWLVFEVWLGRPLP